MIVKVCGVRSAEIAEAAIEAGADWLGLVLEPRSVRHVDDSRAQQVRRAARGRADLVGVMVEPAPADCAEAATRYGLSAIQAHGDISPELATASPVLVIRGINIGRGTGAYRLDWWPDGLVLLDGRPEPGGLPGGTGRRVPLDLAAEVARHRRILLAGGLNGQVVADAIAAVRPYGVDASSGLERAPGEKDAQLVREYVVNARAGFAALQGVGA